DLGGLRSDLLVERLLDSGQDPGHRPGARRGLLLGLVTALLRLALALEHKVLLCSRALTPSCLVSLVSSSRVTIPRWAGPAQAGSCGRPCEDQAMNVTVQTNRGDINLVLFPDHAPKAVKNFVGLATGEQDYQDDAGRKNPEPFYDGLVFHRVIDGFMNQGGCPGGEDFAVPGDTFDDEIHPHQ